MKSEHWQKDIQEDTQKNKINRTQQNGSHVDNLTIPEWQLNELVKRYSDYKSGRLELHDWKETHRILRGVLQMGKITAN